MAAAVDRMAVVVATAAVVITDPMRADLPLAVAWSQLR
jgi:hypothetical protein